MNTQLPSNKSIAEALKACDWSGAPIGNKAIIESAIRALLAAYEQEPSGYLYRTKTHLVSTPWRYAESLPGYVAGESFEVRPQYDHPAPSIPAVPEEPRISSEELDDETLDELIEFRRGTLEYHQAQGNKVQSILHGVVLTAMIELKDRRAAMLQADDGWIPVSERLPDPESKQRVCVYTQTPHEDVRYRFVPASLFKAVCRDATHWQYMTPPSATKAWDC